MLRKHLFSATLAACVSLSALTGAQASTPPADNAIKAALYDIGRSEGQSARLSASRKSAIKRVQRMVEAARARLKQSANKDHASWKEADTRLKAIEQKLAAVSGSAKSHASNAPQTALNRSELSLAQSLARQAVNFIREVSKVKAAEFQQERIRKYFRQRVMNLATQFKTISKPDDPAAASARQQIMQLAQIIAKAEQAAAQQMAELGDVKGRFAEVESRYHRLRLPQVPSKLFTADDVVKYTQTLATIAQQAEKDVAWLNSIKGKTTLIYDSQIDGVLARAQGGLARAIERGHTELARRIQDRIQAVSWRVKYAQETDPQDAGHRMNRLLNASKFETAIAELRKGLEAIEIASAHKTVSTIPKYGDLNPARDAIKQAIAQMEAKFETALAWNGFPKVRSTDSALLAAAKKVLSNPKLAANQIARMEITYDKQRKSRKEGSVDVGAVTTEVEITRYVWDEFAVTTAEKVGDKYYLYSNLLKFFHKGGSDVPVGRWVLAERRQGMRILKEKIEG